MINSRIDKLSQRIDQSDDALSQQMKSEENTNNINARGGLGLTRQKTSECIRKFDLDQV